MSCSTSGKMVFGQGIQVDTSFETVTVITCSSMILSYSVNKVSLKGSHFYALEVL
jgi:hypothetical protein